MPAISSSAPGKIILFGEHAVVYGQPAIAIPLLQVKATAYFLANPAAPQGQIRITAPDIGMDANLNDLPDSNAFRVLFGLMLKHFQMNGFPAMSVRIKSDIPMAAGLGSGTAVSVALIRGLAQFLGEQMADQEVSTLAFEVEKIYHGTPSGVDNTVVTFKKPVYFLKDKPPETLQIGKDLIFLVANSGIKSQTGLVVGEVRNKWLSDRDRVEAIFNSISSLTNEAREALTLGNDIRLGKLMTCNHRDLVDLEVSNERLDQMVDAAIKAGALGAKLSGAGKGGNMIALVREAFVSRVLHALESFGTGKVLQTTLTQTI